MMIDKIILGQNQFFGVNHISDSKGTKRGNHFRNIKNIISFLKDSVELGIEAITLTTHPMTPLILDEIKKDKLLVQQLKIYPGIPDPGKLLRMTADLGIPNTILRLMGGTTLKQKSSMLFQGSVGLLKQNPYKLIKTLLEVEYSMFNGLNVPGIFLTNNVNDLCLGLNLKGVIEEYISFCNNKNIIPCFNTLNLPFHVEKMKAYHLKSYPVMSALNMLGFFVNPSLSSVEQILVEGDIKLVAMNVLASGAINPNDAYNYVCSNKSVTSICFGASTIEHVTQNLESIEKYWRN